MTLLNLLREAGYKVVSATQPVGPNSVKLELRSMRIDTENKQARLEIAVYYLATDEPDVSALDKVKNLVRTILQHEGLSGEVDVDFEHAPQGLATSIRLTLIEEV